MDYDHYYFKLEQMRNKPNSDPNKVIRVVFSVLRLPPEPEQVPRVPDDLDEHLLQLEVVVVVVHLQVGVRDGTSHLPRLRVPDAALSAEGVLLGGGGEHVQVQGDATPRGRADGSAGGAAGGFAGRSRRPRHTHVLAAPPRPARSS